MPDERESRKERKRQSLLAAAYGLFTEKGVAKTSVDEIVRRANVAKGTFYLYFQDKYVILGLSQEKELIICVIPSQEEILW